nr:hypothetical protein [Nonomuraea basaltis]
MKIHDWCCHGLSAFWARMRRTVEAEIAAARPRATASRASSPLLQRDNGTPVSAGNWQASAVICARCSEVIRGGRPKRCRSVRLATPRSLS